MYVLSGLNRHCHPRASASVQRTSEHGSGRRHFTHEALGGRRKREERGGRGEGQMEHNSRLRVRLPLPFSRILFSEKNISMPRALLLPPALHGYSSFHEDSATRLRIRVASTSSTFAHNETKQPKVAWDSFRAGTGHAGMNNIVVVRVLILSSFLAFMCRERITCRFGCLDSLIVFEQIHSCL